MSAREPGLVVVWNGGVAPEGCGIMRAGRKMSQGQ